jgi:predicted outer membrane repeat protein
MHFTRTPKSKSLSKSIATGLLGLTVGLWLASTSALPALAGTTYYVSNSGSDTNAGTDPAFPKQHIQAGIDATANGDVVTVADGTYTGAGNKDLDFAGKAITARSASNDPAKCIIDCQGSGRGFYFHSGETTTSVVQDFTIQHGAGRPGRFVSGNIGGGIYNDFSGPAVLNCAFTGNSTTGAGGAIASSGGSGPTVIGCTFTGNSTGRGGGAIASIYSGSTVIDCTFTENRAGSGGAISTSPGTLTLIHCTFTRNSAPYGGALNNSETSLTMIRCLFLANHADGDENAGLYGQGGGAMRNFDNGSSGEGPAATDCVFIANTASGNGASGGAIINVGSSPTLTNCTFAGNTASAGGGMFSSRGVNGGGRSGPNYIYSRPKVYNSIFWGDIADSGAEIYNDTYSSVFIQSSDVQGGLAENPLIVGNIGDGGGNINADPLFVNTVLGDLHLSAGSPCIDTGDNNAPGLVGITTDLDGLPRFVGAAVDMGAFEFQAVAPVLVAVDDSATVQGFHLLTIPVLANDIVPPGASVTITAVSRASHGAVSIGPNGTVRYRPLPGFTGMDQFTYTITDGQGHTATARVTVTVTGA